MAFIDNPTNDPAIRRSERLARYGSMIPGLCWALINLAVTILSAATKSTLTKEQYIAIVIAFVIAGQVVVWLGMAGLRRCSGWDCGILPYLWSGGILTCLVAAGTLIQSGAVAIVTGAIVPWAAPVVASIARRRLLRSKGVSMGKGAAA